LNVCISMILLGIVVLFADGGRHDVVEAIDDPPAVAEEPIEQSPIDQTPIVQEPEWNAGWVVGFMTDTADLTVVWEHGDVRLYVQSSQLLYSSGEVESQVVYEWFAPLQGQAWTNGEYVLIGTQLAAVGSSYEKDHGGWLAIKVSPKPTILYQETRFYGPQEVLSVTVTDQPRLFFFSVVNGSSFSEYAFDPYSPVWISTHWGLIDSTVPLTTPAKVDGMKHFADSRVFRLSDGTEVYSFVDEFGNVVYFKQRSDSFAIRHVGYELVDVKRIASSEGSPLIWGHYRNLAGDDRMAFLHSDDIFPMEPRLWEDDWQAFDRITFTRYSPEKLEGIRLRNPDYSVVDSSWYRQFPLQGAKLVSSKGSRMEFEVGGETKYISWYDVMNTADGSEVDPELIWSAPLERYTTREGLHEYDFFDYGRQSGMVLEWMHPYDYVYGYGVYNTNAPLPDGYLDALGDKYGYGMHDGADSLTTRKIGAKWYALYGRKISEFVDGDLTEIGEWPVAQSVEIGDGFSGHGPRDFVRAGNYWFVADTEASRVIKMNDRMEVVAELAVPTPDRILVDGKRLNVDSLTSIWTVDLDLQVMEIKTKPFASSAKLNKLVNEYFSDQQRYVDQESGITWYYLGGMLYQYNEGKQEFRTLFMSYNENQLAQVRILPYGDEILVVLDRRLERFDRKGNWLGTIEYPRSNPDGIYAETPLGENSQYFDEEAGILYLVQGYRVLGIDLNQGEVRTIFRQNYSNIGKLIPYEGSLYFMLHSSNDHHYDVWSRKANPKDLFIEVVKIDLQTSAIRRFLVDEYYDVLDIEPGTDGQPVFNLLRNTW